MLQKLKKRIKNQRGMTLVELLAVIVILGIISAIAVPSIGGLIDNTKKDAHVANAQQMVNAAKLAITTDTNLQTGTKYLTLGYLQEQNYLETVKDPDDKGYNPGSKTDITTVPATSASYVQVEGGIVTGVKLVNTDRGVQGDKGVVVAPNDLKRGVVKP
jgi:type IV pilus assembly protein PilA